MARWGAPAAGWSYGDTHRLHLQHPLGAVPVLGRWFNRGPFPYPGSETTVAAFGTGSGAEQEQIAYGPSMRWISDPGDPDRSRAILPTGQSGHPADTHYDDQFERYRRGELRPVYWSEAAAEAAAVSRLRLVPGRPQAGASR